MGNQYLATIDKEEKNLICRTAAQHIYEFFQGGSRVIGPLTVTANNLKDQNTIDDFSKFRKTFNELKVKYESTLKEVRHHVSGHKDRDVRKQLEIMEKIDVNAFQDIFFVIL